MSQNPVLQDKSAFPIRLIPSRLFSLVEYILVPANFAVLVFSAVPLLFLLVLLKDFAANVPYWDQWDTSLNVALATRSGTLSLADLFVQHNEHRIFFSNLLVAFLTAFNGWETRYEMIFSIGLAGLNWLLVLTIVHKQQPGSERWLAVPAAFLIFALRQSENWLWGFQTQWFIPLTFFLLAIIILIDGRPGWLRLIFAALCAACAMISFSAGLLTWPLLLVGIWLLGYRSWQHFAFWIVMAVICIGLYFTNYAGTPGSGGSILDAPYTFIQYVMLYLANPFSSNVTGRLDLMAVTAVGLLLFLSNSLLLLQQNAWRLRILAPWWLIAGFAIGAALTAGSGRSDLGVTQALSYRYASIAIWLWVAVAALAVLAIWQMRASASAARWQTFILYGDFLSVTVLAFLFIQANFVSFYALPKQASDAHAVCLKRFPFTQDVSCMTAIYPSTERLSERALLLLREDLGVFTDTETYHLARDNAVIFQDDVVIEAVEWMQIEGVPRPVLLQPAASAVQTTVFIPDTNDHYWLESAIYGLFDGETDRGTLDFEVSVETEEGTQQTVYQQVFDLQTADSPRTFRVDLTDFAGENIMLILWAQSDKLSLNPVWVDPLIIEGKKRD